jgi:hypothetical protein
MSFYTNLSKEVNDDPLGIGYSTMTDQEVADSLNAVNRTVPHKQTTFATLYESLQANSITDLSNPNRSRWDASVVPLSNLERFEARGNILGQLNTIWGPGTPEYDNYITNTQDIMSRATEIGANGPDGVVDKDHVANVRA